jgi:hypothetical protein
MPVVLNFTTPVTDADVPVDDDVLAEVPDDVKGVAPLKSP